MWSPPVSEERFRALVESSREVMLLLDRDGRITYATPSVETQFGWRAGDIGGRALVDFLHPEDQKPFAERLGNLVPRPGDRTMTEIRFRHADGTYRSVDALVANRLHEPGVDSLVLDARDITEGRRLEDQLRQAQKMEAVGRLAGGVAHDFNNLLTAILGYCNLALEEMPADEPTRKDLEEIRDAGERAATLTRQLLAFSRRQTLQPEPVDLNALVRQVERMLRRLIGEDIELEAALSAELPLVKADRASIEQIVVNLAVNARDAMPAGGRLTIETSRVDLDQTYADAHVTVAPGSYVLLAVSDTGHGMDAATRARVFEPFFTTKPQGKGSGLGLSTVYGIVKQTGGYIWVYSEPARGTVFKVYLPVADRSASASAAEHRAGTAVSPSETVLVVEDEDAVRALTCELLRRRGYQVLEAAHGIDALSVAAAHGGRIDLLLTDIVMPYMNGRDLAVQMAVLRPATKVLFVSGYTDHVAARQELAAGAPFLQKPFTPDALARKIRSVLDSLTSGADA
jgi:PAS domain S-box-containing protein